MNCCECTKCWALLAYFSIAPDGRTMTIESLVHNKHNVADDQDSEQTDLIPSGKPPVYYGIKKT